MAEKLTKEEQILDGDYRRLIIKEILEGEAQRRKREAFKRYECLKDRTDIYVLELLLNQFDASTVQEMQYAVTNISIARKIIDKLARVYNSGVKRTLDKKTDTKAIEELAQKLDFNTKMKKLNRYLKAFKNTLAYVKPVKCLENEVEKFRLELSVLPPFLYDVIEDSNDPTKAGVVILSNFQPTRERLYSLSPATAGRTNQNVRAVESQRGDGEDGILADAPTDTPQTEFIWWSKNYHFTTDEKGVLKSEAIDNPIGELPFVNFCGDQDESFWSIGGHDLFDGGIKINTLLTNINHVAICQGYGQLYMTGKNLPKSVKVGPNHAIQLEVAEGEPDPKVGFLSANPPVNDLMGLVEMYAALLLSTNNLSTSGFAANLRGGGPGQAASGVALMIDKSESMEDVEEQAQVFRDNEPKVWKLLSKWHELFKKQKLLTDELMKMPVPADPKVSLQFTPPQPLMSEMDKLAVLEKRKELGLDTAIEMLMRDNPDLTEGDAEKKLANILKEKIDNAIQFMGGPNGDASNSGNGLNPEDQGGQAQDQEQSSNQDMQAQEQGKQMPEQMPSQKSGMKLQSEVSKPKLTQITDPTLSLNGAQVTAMLDILDKVAQGLLPRDSGVEMLVAAFSVPRDDAERIMGSIGAGFKPAVQEQPKEAPVPPKFKEKQ